MNFVAMPKTATGEAFNLLVGGGLSIEHGNRKPTLVPRASLLSAAGAHHGGGRSGSDDTARLG